MIAVCYNKHLTQSHWKLQQQEQNLLKTNRVSKRFSNNLNHLSQSRIIIIIFFKLPSVKIIKVIMVIIMSLLKYLPSSSMLIKMLTKMLIKPTKIIIIISKTIITITTIINNPTLQNIQKSINQTYYQSAT